ncbi:MAG: NAD(P)H-dependent oxidoreductase [Deltaproteobacteria bacterium]|nr:NAD(P)H-dependent oxidoreductase [Deltaproteobacteria bacterium]
MSKKLVAYFSATGVTAAVAKQLAEMIIGADLYAIRPKTPYTADDLNWNDPQSRSSVEMRDKAFRPELADKNAHLEDYDMIFLGFPIWWYVAPTIINTFLESYDCSGKTIVLFATSGSTGFGKTVEGLLPSAPGATFHEGEVFHGKPANKGVHVKWLREVLK